MLPRINATDDRIGFHWSSPDGPAMRLVEVFELPDAEADRLLPTHLEALDDVLIDVAGRPQRGMPLDRPTLSRVRRGPQPDPRR